MPAFTGFTPEAIHFLLELSINNDRGWFQPRKAEFERLLKEPLEALCIDLGERFRKRKIPLRADTGSPFRIYRDVRFSKDKSPYKTYVSASFPWDEPGTPAPAPAGTRGRPPARRLLLVRAGPDVPGRRDVARRPCPPRGLARARRRRPQRLHAVIDAPKFKKAFGDLDAEDRLKRVPPGYPADHPDAELLKLKDVLFGRRLTDAEALSPDLPDVLADAFATATPLLRLLASLAPK